MKTIAVDLAAGLLILSLTGCALVPDTPPAPTPTPLPPPSGYEPQPGDENLKRDKVLLDSESISVKNPESPPVQVTVELNGTLSDPCHQLRVVVSPPNANREINLDVYTVFDPTVACIMMIKPFTASIPLGTFSGGHFTVLVNGKVIGEFDA